MILLPNVRHKKLDNQEHKNIECRVHGLQQTTYVCQHIIEALKDGEPRGFFWSIEDPENPRPDAWCFECNEKVKETDGEWADEILDFVKVSVLCGACYDRAKEINLGPDKKWWRFWN